MVTAEFWLSSKFTCTQITLMISRFHKESVDDGKSSNVNVDDKSFSASSFEEGESSKDNEGTILFLNRYTLMSYLKGLTHIYIFFFFHFYVR